jgi:hypothetical protein
MAAARRANTQFEPRRDAIAQSRETMTPEEKKIKHREEQKKYRLRHPEKWKLYIAKAKQDSDFYRKQSRDRRKSNPQREIAYCRYYRAVKSGRLIRPNHCSKCGVICKPEGHHEDYSKPLEVQWLCRRCHLEVERPAAPVSKTREE